MAKQIEKIDPEEHAKLLYKLSELPYDKARQLEQGLQMYLQHYNKLWAELDETVKKYKETAQKIKGGE